jgi:4a-hydroxytetrahydrobiopterin dehydratase
MLMPMPTKMPAMALASERCVPCEGGTPPLSRQEAQSLLAQLGDGWQLSEDARTLSRQLSFKNFLRAMDFLNQLAQVAEQENHHPDFCLQGWNKVSLSLSTHAIGGLSRNDFIMAARLDDVAKSSAG